MSTAEDGAKNGGLTAADVAAELHAEDLADIVSLQAHFDVLRAALEAIVALPAGESSRAASIAAAALAARPRPR